MYHSYSLMNVLTFIIILLVLGLFCNAVFAQATLDYGKAGDTAFGNKDYATALQDYSVAAGQGNNYAKLKLGMLYCEGKGVTQNTAECLKLLKQIDPHGDALLEALLGEMEAAYNDPTDGLAWLQKAVDAGQSKSEDALGGYYERGKIVKQNFHTALILYQKSAQQGDVNGEYDIARFYINGAAGPKNYELAAKYLEQSANQGNGEAQYLLGLLYKEGKGVPLNYIEWAKWLVLAFYYLPDNTSDEHEKIIGIYPSITYSQLTIPQKRQAAKEATNWLLKHNGGSTAGIDFYKNIGVPELPHQ